MNSIHDKGEKDSALNDGLEKLGQAYGRLDRDEPPELLDQAILNSAHRAVEKKPHWMQFGWLHGLTTAAVFVLAFSIIMNQREPVPEFENGIMNYESERSQSIKFDKKSTVGRVDELRIQKEAPVDDRQKAQQDMPAVAAPESPARESAPSAPEEQVRLESTRSMYVTDSVPAKAEPADNDTHPAGLLQEEVILDETDLVADSPQAEAVSKLASPAENNKPATNDLKSRVRMESGAEQKLREIINLKQSGDETWKTELELFIKTYPDYPLPEELKE